MFYGPTERCLFCKSQYYVDKLNSHEAICSMRPLKLTVGEAIRIALESHPAASTNTALLVRLVWQIKDGYLSEHPRDRLTDPESIVKEFRKHRRASALSRKRDGPGRPPFLADSGSSSMLSAEDDDNREADATIRDILRMLAVTGPAVAETASQIYLAAKGRMPFGYSFRQVRAASVYASCRLFGVPRTLKEVASACDLDVIPLASCYRRVIEDAGLTMPVQDPASYVPGISSRAGLDPPTERRAIEIIDTAKGLRTTEGKAPTAVAAAALYMAYRELHQEESLDPGTRVTQLDIAEAAGITEVTLRNRLRTIGYAVEKRSSKARVE